MDDKNEIGGERSVELEHSYNKLKITNVKINQKNTELENAIKSYLLILSNNKKVYTKLISEIDKRILDDETKKYLKGIIRESQSENIWNEIDYEFLQINEVFFKKLSISFPDLTKNDLKICALIIMNLSNKEIARIQYVSHGSVKVSKFRLRKKLNLNNSKTSLLAFLNAFEV